MPSPIRFASASFGALVAVIVTVVAILVLAARAAALGFGPLGDVVASGLRVLVIGAVIWGAAWGLLLLVRRIAADRRDAVVLATVALGIAGVAVAGLLIPTPAARVLAVVAVGLAAWIGAAAGSLARVRSHRREEEAEGGNPARCRRRFRFAVLNLSAAVLASLVLGSWLFLGASEDSSALIALDEGPRPAFLPGPSPADRGTFQVGSFTYGSGSDARRPEYADSVTLRTPTVNLAPLLPGFTGADAQLHRDHWGFGLDAIPLNARVWVPLPSEPGLPEETHPVVLVIPGIDPNSVRSELGYAYLAELLASRGYVVVAMDVNFLGGPRISARAAEMPVRAWLALEHLRLLAEWKEADPTGIPGLFDLERIGLVGHSRGGEAAALAAMLNQLERYPDNAAIPLSFGFGIRSVVALAPTDRHYRPTGRATTLSDVSYLAVHGSHDGDLGSFLGSGQYQRATLSGAADASGTFPFRALVHVEGANHANFSTRRVGSDQPGFVRRLTDRRALLPAEDQRQVAAVFTSAFLDATLRGDVAIRGVFRDPRVAGDWLPRTRFVTRFDDGRTLVLADFEADLDPVSGTLEGVRIEGRHLELWREEPLRHRGGDGADAETMVVRLGWNREGRALPEPSFELRLPERSGPDGALSPELDAVLRGGSSLIFSLGVAAPSGGAPDLSVEVETRSGLRARISLDFLGPVPEPVKVRLWRLPFLDERRFRGPEQLLQTFEVPLAVFELTEPGLEARDLEVIRFVFDRTPVGEILLDHIGLRPPAR
jgi:dienelactone hydrolase